MIVEAAHLNKSYGSLQVLKNVSIAIQKGEIVSIVGASGAGKSTLLQILGTLDTADSGQIIIDGQNITQLQGKKLAAFRNQKIGFVFQFHHLLPEFTALENIMMPVKIANISTKKAQAKATFLLELLGLPDKANNKPDELSGGEQQRVAIARALINDPAIVMADEPTGNLDSANANHLHNIIGELRAKLNQTFLIVTHNAELEQISDRIITMRDGKVV